MDIEGSRSWDMSNTALDATKPEVPPPLFLDSHTGTNFYIY